MRRAHGKSAKADKKSTSSKELNDSPVRQQKAQAQAKKSKKESSTAADARPRKKQSSKTDGAKQHAIGRGQLASICEAERRGSDKKSGKISRSRTDAGIPPSDETTPQRQSSTAMLDALLESMAAQATGDASGDSEDSISIALSNLREYETDSVSGDSFSTSGGIARASKPRTPPTAGSVPKRQESLTPLIFNLLEDLAAGEGTPIASQQAQEMNQPALRIGERASVETAAAAPNRPLSNAALASQQGHQAAIVTAESGFAARQQSLRSDLQSLIARLSESATRKGQKRAAREVLYIPERRIGGQIRTDLSHGENEQASGISERTLDQLKLETLTRVRELLIILGDLRRLSNEAARRGELLDCVQVIAESLLKNRRLFLDSGLRREMRHAARALYEHADEVLGATNGTSNFASAEARAIELKQHLTSMLLIFKRALENSGC